MLHCINLRGSINYNLNVFSMKFGWRFLLILSIYRNFCTLTKSVSTWQGNWNLLGCESALLSTAILGSCTNCTSNTEIITVWNIIFLKLKCSLPTLIINFPSKHLCEHPFFGFSVLDDMFKNIDSIFYKFVSIWICNSFWNAWILRWILIFL